MSKEWYLLSSSTKPNSIGGYENEGFQDYKDDAFSEALETDIATNITLYNHDLSESQVIRCIIQGNSADTMLKSMERIGLFSIGTVKAGMYVFFENRYWLIDGLPGTQGIYEKATMCLCQYNLRWQNKNGDIVERWCNITSASKYDVGENGNNTIFLTSNNYAIKIPYDEETIELETKRVFIDRHKDKPIKVFKLTRDDDVLYDYGDEYHGSILNFIADKDEFNEKYDNQELRICNYNSSASNPNIPSEPQEKDVIASILGSDTLKLGKERVWSVEFKDSESNQIEYADFKWNVVSNFDIKKSVDGITIHLFIDDDSYLEESFVVQILNLEDKIMAEKTITVEEGY